jgi:hypothetical protein
MTRSERQPEVIVDFIFEDGLFFIAIQNIGTGPARDVSVEFDKKFTGVHGTKEVSALPLFKKIPFFAPQKEIRVFLDHSAAYFRRRQPVNIRATVRFKDSSGAVHTATMKHDLRIYQDIGYVRRHDSAGHLQPAAKS